jgi:hypothetical protein
MNNNLFPELPADHPLNTGEGIISIRKAKDLTIRPGDYVHIFIPNRQRLVPCQVEASTESRGWVCRPLKKCSVHRYVVPSVQIIDKINPKEINKP